MAAIDNCVRISFPILFWKNGRRLDGETYTHKNHGGVFQYMDKSPGYLVNEHNVHLSPAPVMIRVLTLQSEEMGHRKIWKFTECAFDELMEKIEL